MDRSVHFLSLRRTFSIESDHQHPMRLYRSSGMMQSISQQVALTLSHQCSQWSTIFPKRILNCRISLSSDLPQLCWKRLLRRNQFTFSTSIASVAMDYSLLRKILCSTHQSSFLASCQLVIRSELWRETHQMSLWTLWLTITWLANEIRTVPKYCMAKGALAPLSWIKTWARNCSKMISLSVRQRSNL